MSRTNRSVELRYQYDTEYKDVPVKRFAANEWFLNNDDGCFCLNVTNGINKEDGCLLKGAIELYNCVGKCHIQLLMLKNFFKLK